MLTILPDQTTRTMSLKALSVPGLSVVCSDEPDFFAAVLRQAFNPRIPSERLPDAVVRATTVAAIQEAVAFCATNGITVSARCGGHNWHSSWLRGKGSVVLHVGDLNEIRMGAEDNTVSTGPGALGSDVLTKIPADKFFPCGHCSSVPVGGFVLGGGYGLGFPKYGMTSTLVQAVDVVLASGEVVHATTASSDHVSQAIMHLLKGGYSGFPAVVTQ